MGRNKNSQHRIEEKYKLMKNEKIPKLKKRLISYIKVFEKGGMVLGKTEIKIRL